MGCDFFIRNAIVILSIIGVCICNTMTAAENERYYEPVQHWPKYDRFGQISAVETDTEGNVYVFHRGSRQWNAYTFHLNTFVGKDPIPEETIIVLESTEGTLLKKIGGSFFYLPHGLTVDDEHNVWLTDVAMHQVFKFPPFNFSEKTDINWKPILTLGVLMEPGNDDKHFCKPTSVAVDKVTKDFYVSDGYCNARIIKYDRFGKKLLQWGRKFNGFPMQDYMLNVPHSLALAQDKKILFVADREDFRVVSFDSEFGKFQRTFAEEFKSRIYSVAYSPLQGGLLYALANNGSSTKTVLVYAANTGNILLNFFPKNYFMNPHDLALSPDGRYCYIVSLKPYKMWKMEIDFPRIWGTLDRSSPEKATAVTIKRIEEEPVPAESKINKSGNAEAPGSSYLAVGLVISVIVVFLLMLMLHYYRNNAGYRRHEARRLILDDDDDGIQLA